MSPPILSNISNTRYLVQSDVLFIVLQKINLIQLKFSSHRCIFTRKWHIRITKKANGKKNVFLCYTEAKSQDGNDSKAKTLVTVSINVN